MNLYEVCFAASLIATSALTWKTWSKDKNEASNTAQAQALRKAYLPVCVRPPNMILKLENSLLPGHSPAGHSPAAQPH